MLESTNRSLSIVVTQTKNGSQIVVGRLDFPIYQQPVESLLSRKEKREALGYPSSLAATMLPREIDNLVVAKHRALRGTGRLFSREWVSGELVDQIRTSGYNVHGPFETSWLRVRDELPPRDEALTDGLRRIGASGPRRELG